MTQGSTRLAYMRLACASALEAFGLDPTAPGETLSSDQCAKLESIASMDCYNVPAKLVSLAKSQALSRNEANQVLRSAYGTWQPIGGPVPFEMALGLKTFAEAREDAREELVAAGHISPNGNSDPGRGRGTSCITPRQAAYLLALSRNPDFDVDPLQLSLAMRGLLTSNEASRVISAVKATYLHLKPFSLTE